MIHTPTPDLHQRGRVCARHHIGEHCQVTAHTHTAFVVHSYRGEGNAGTDVLEGQVEASFVQGANTSNLGE